MSLHRDVQPGLRDIKAGVQSVDPTSVAMGTALVVVEVLMVGVVKLRCIRSVIMFEDEKVVILQTKLLVML